MIQNSLKQQITEVFIKSLEENILPWKKMWATSKPHNAVSNIEYKGINNLWLSIRAFERGFNDPRWCTFNQAKQNGWNIEKGAKSEKIEFFSVYDKLQKKNISMSEFNKIVSTDKNRKKDMQIVTKQFSVFNAAEIGGIPKLSQAATVNIDFIKKQRDILIKNMSLSFIEAGERAFYSPINDSITMPPDTSFKNDYAYMATLLHECGHATGYPSRLNRNLEGGFGSAEYAKEELRAEIASAFTAQELSFGSNKSELADALDNHKAYIQSWISVIKNKPDELFSAIKDAEKISDYLMEKGDFKINKQQVQTVPEPKQSNQTEPQFGRPLDLINNQEAEL